MNEYVTTIGAYDAGYASAYGATVPPSVDGPRPPAGEGWTMCGSVYIPEEQAICWFWTRPEPIGVWVDGNKSTWVIASTAEDALATWGKSIGEAPDGYDADEWTRLADGHSLTICCDAEGKPCELGDGSTMITRTCAEWAKRGRGLLCTTET